MPQKDRMDNYSIEVRNLSKKFGNFTAVDNISFSVNQRPLRFSDHFVVVQNKKMLKKLSGYAQPILAKNLEGRNDAGAVNFLKRLQDKNFKKRNPSLAGCTCISFKHS